MAQDSRSDDQEIPCIVRNPKIHYLKVRWTVWQQRTDVSEHLSASIIRFYLLSSVRWILFDCIPLTINVLRPIEMSDTVCTASHPTSHQQQGGEYLNFADESTRRPRKVSLQIKLTYFHSFLYLPTACLTPDFIPLITSDVEYKSYIPSIITSSRLPPNILLGTLFISEIWRPVNGNVGAE